MSSLHLERWRVADLSIVFYPTVLCGWWRLIESGDLLASFGPVLVFASCWLGLVLAGALFGLVSDTFDSDTVQL